jgi:hypothetical protein
MMGRGLKGGLDGTVNIENHTQFRPFNASVLTLLCNNMGSEHTKIGWLSREKFVKVFELRSKVYSFLLITHSISPTVC